ncbi:MAG TPA: acyl-CoA dehydrogenase family protein, partial [Ilumatobacteraceae bacterium]|nr:acyl-CoA dehydrogenase family protein [Ilumatobacteraceae bacterium]
MGFADARLHSEATGRALDGGSSGIGVDPQPDDVRSAVRDWLAEHWSPDLDLYQWRSMLVDAGWAVPAWPRTWFGQELPDWSVPLVANEIDATGAVGIAVGGGTTLAAPSILALGPDSLRHRFLHRTITGEVTWCQLFSEPGAGSDLAGLSTSAVLDGDRWIVNGQKLWNTSAHHADYGLLLARTDPAAPKHAGITYFVLPMHQPGVEVRPLRQMNDHSSFNEVFLTDAEVPVDLVIGEVGKGWTGALTTLAFE